MGLAQAQPQPVYARATWRRLDARPQRPQRPSPAIVAPIKMASSIHCDETKTMCCVPLQQADLVVVGSIITKQEHNASTMMLDSLSTPILKP